MAVSPTSSFRPPSRVRRWAIACILLTLIVAGFVVRRIVVDLANATRSDQVIPNNDLQYHVHPVVAYVHILSGAIYLGGAALQLSARVRMKHYAFHRWLGRVVLPCGFVTGVFAIYFGFRYPLGGVVEALAAGLFGVWFLGSLLAAYRAIRRHDIARHRRWMVRAYSIGLAVGTIRIWVGLLAGTGLVSLPTSFAAGFWLAFVMHAVAAEWWLQTHPHPPEAQAGDH